MRVCAATMKQSECFPQTWNAYAYVGNQPLTLVDPLGLVCQEDQVNQDCEPGFSQGTGGYGDGGFGGGDSGGGWSEFGLMQVPVVQQYGYSLAYFGGTQQPGPSWSGVMDQYGFAGYSATSALFFGGTWVPEPEFATVGNGFELLGLSQPPGSGTAATTEDRMPSAAPMASQATFQFEPKTSQQCSVYLDGTGSGSALFQLCSKVFPNGPSLNRMRGCLESLYLPSKGYLPIPLVVFDPAPSVVNIPGAGAHLSCALAAGRGWR